jgi:uncharacterized protein (TIRG00374 family)
MTAEDKKRNLRIVLSILLGLALVGLLVYMMDIPKLVRSLREANLPLVAVACVINVLVMGAKGTRWYLIGASSSSLSLWQSIRLTILAFFFNSFIPARGGDVIRGLAAARENRASRTASIATVGLDKLMDMLTVFFLALGFPFLPNLPAWVKRGTLISLILAFALLVGVVVIAVKGRGLVRPERHPRLAKFFGMLASGFDSAVRPRIILLAVVLSLLSYAFQMAMVFLCCRSTGIGVGVAEAACALLVLNVAVSVPLTPLNVGTMHAALVAVLIFLGNAREPALTAAIALHVAYQLPLFVLAPFLGHRTFLARVRGEPGSPQGAPSGRPAADDQEKSGKV